MYHSHVRRIVTILGVVIAVSVFLYGTFLLMAVAHAAAIAKTNKNIRTVTTEVSKLENSYLTLTKSLTLGDAIAMGFLKPSSIAVMYAQTPASLTLR